MAATIPLPPLEAHPLTQRVGGFCPRCGTWRLRETDVAVVNAATLVTEQRYTVADCVCGHEDITR